ncbi:MAG TPA: hypothetical protein VIV83_13970, partial [Gemmatimonadales bacterium]
GDGTAVTVVPGGRTMVKLPNPPSLDLPDGFAALIETRVTTASGSVAARRTTLTPAARGATGGSGQ